MAITIDLEKYRDKLDNLVRKKKITQDTAGTYYSCLKVVVGNYQGSDLDAMKLKNFMIEKCKGRNDFLKYVAAVRKYEDEVLGIEKGLLFGEPEVELFQKFKGKNISSNFKIIRGGSEDSVFRKINAIRNEKLKLGFRLQLKSGLRVAEIAKIEKNDIEFLEYNQILIHVRDGKGRKSRDTFVQQDKYLYDRLIKHVMESKEDKLFYSRSYIKQKANEYGIRSHDLRRINAKNRLKEEKKKGKSTSEAVKVVQRELGHERIETTYIYLKYDFKK